MQASKSNQKWKKEKTFCWLLDTYRLSRISPGTMITLRQGKDKDKSTSHGTTEIFWVHAFTRLLIYLETMATLCSISWWSIYSLWIKQHNHNGQFVDVCLWKPASLVILHRKWTRLTHPLSNKASVSWGTFDSSGSFTTLKNKWFFCH